MYSKCINLNKFLPWNKHLEQLLQTVTLHLSVVWKLEDY